MKLLNLIKTILDIIKTVLSIINQTNELLSHELIRRLLFIIEAMPIC